MALNVGHTGGRPRPYAQKVGFRPTRPVWLAGNRVEPPPSLLVHSGTMAAAYAAAAPPEEPPGDFWGFQGLRVTPKTRLDVTAVCANSGVLVFPTGIAPAAQAPHHGRVRRLGFVLRV